MTGTPPLTSKPCSHCLPPWNAPQCLAARAAGQWRRSTACTQCDSLCQNLEQQQVGSVCWHSSRRCRRAPHPVHTKHPPAAVVAGPAPPLHALQAIHQSESQGWCMDRHTPRSGAAPPRCMAAPVKRRRRQGRRRQAVASRAHCWVDKPEAARCFEPLGGCKRRWGGLQGDKKITRS